MSPNHTLLSERPPKFRVSTSRFWSEKTDPPLKGTQKRAKIMSQKNDPFLTFFDDFYVIERVFGVLNAVVISVIKTLKIE